MMIKPTLFQPLAKAVRTIPADDLPAIVGQLVELEERARLRLRTEASGNGAGSPEEPAPEWLTPPEAAAIFRVTPRWLNRATSGKGFRRQESRRTIRYENAGLRRWLARRA
jgi:hypothetical protein